MHVPIYVSVSLRSAHAEEAGGNLITQMVIRLPVGGDDPVPRLRAIATRTAKGKSLVRPSLGTTFRNRVLSAAVLKLIVRQRVNLASADLPGPQQPVYFAGAQILEVFPLLNLIGNVSLRSGSDHDVGIGCPAPISSVFPSMTKVPRGRERRPCPHTHVADQHRDRNRGGIDDRRHADSGPRA